MSGRTDNLLASSILNKVSLNTGKTFLKSCIEVEAFSWNSDTVESHCILSLRADDNNQSAGAISIELIEVADTGEASAGAGVESSASS